MIGVRALSPGELLGVWEEAAGRGSAERALALLALVCPDLGPEALGELRVDQQNERLLALREQLFGRELVAVANCPRCRERCELTLDAEEVRARGEVAAGAGEEATAAPTEHVVSVDGRTIRFRVATAADLVAAGTCPTVDEARALLLARCIVSIDGVGRSASAPEVGDVVRRAVEDAIERLSPQAEVRLTLSCPACGETWEGDFDVVSFLWAEIEAWARRTLRDVHELALTYGWSESQVLALSPRRRRLYLELIGG